MVLIIVLITLYYLLPYQSLSSLEGILYSLALWFGLQFLHGIVIVKQVWLANFWPNTIILCFITMWNFKTLKFTLKKKRSENDVSPSPDFKNLSLPC